MQTTTKAPLFQFGQIVATPGALAAREKAGQQPGEFLARHGSGDSGDLDEHDRKENQLSLERGFRLLQFLFHKCQRKNMADHRSGQVRHNPTSSRRVLSRTETERKGENEMTAVLESKTIQGLPPAVSSMQDIPLAHIQESNTNPRRQFDEAKLAELSDNIRLHGVLQPVLLRPLPGGEAGFYELVAGARRYRASKLAGRETIPATVRELTDTQCLELQLIENLQRADVHELDEARGYAALMQLQPENNTVEVLAEKIGRSEKYVYARLRLHALDRGRSGSILRRQAHRRPRV